MSTSTMDKKILSLVKDYSFRHGLPIIPIKAENISILATPESFYKTLLKNIDSCRKRLVFSALYLGTDAKEETFVNILRNKLGSDTNVCSRMIFDSNRAQRCDNLNRSTMSIIGDLVQKSNFALNLLDFGISVAWPFTYLKNRPAFKEILSIYHGKLLIFDDDVMITGANLSKIYFENRQDRYMFFKQSNALADYFDKLFQNVLNSPTNLKQKIISHNLDFIESNPFVDNNSEFTLAIPLIQHGPSNIKDMEEFLTFLTENITETDTNLYLSTGYFNPSRCIESISFDSILVPSKETNGFHEGKGLLKYVPLLYNRLLQNYLVHKRDCKVSVYSKPGWSFHGKGIWIEAEGIAVNIIGSSNFNLRSSERDFEFQIALVTNDKNLVRNLRNERERLWAHSYPVTVDSRFNLLERLVIFFIYRYL